MKKFETSYLEIEGNRIPLKIYREWRSNVRVSMGKHAVILRLPSIMGIGQQSQQIEWCRNWVRDQLRQSETLQSRYIAKQYKTGDRIQVGERAYTLHLAFSKERKTHTARLADGVIYLEINAQDNPDHIQKSMKLLISRIVGQDFLPSIVRRVHEINRLYFRQSIKNVRMKYNRSNWGSCSAKGNVNLSTRLLFAPDEVIDYVIIHELAHLIELNHSPRFWKIVREAMPDYKQKEQWLKMNGHLCDF